MPGPFISVPTKVMFLSFISACLKSCMRYPPIGAVQQPSVIESPTGMMLHGVFGVVGQ
jgi:hypothetical protein